MMSIIHLISMLRIRGIKQLWNQATFDMEGNILEGAFPDRQKKLVSAWAVLHKDELLANWELAREDQALFRIDPLR